MAEAFSPANCSMRILESITRKRWPAKSPISDNGLFDVNCLRPPSQSATGSRPLARNDSSTALPKVPLRSLRETSRSDGRMYGMSSTDTTGLKPPRNAAGVIAISIEPSCVPSIICRPPPSCDDGNTLISTSPLVRSLINSAALSSPRCFAVVVGSCDASLASNLAAFAAGMPAMQMAVARIASFELQRITHSFCCCGGTDRCLARWRGFRGNRRALV